MCHHPSVITVIIWRLIYFISRSVLFGFMTIVNVSKIQWRANNPVLYRIDVWTKRKKNNKKTAIINKLRVNMGRLVNNHFIFPGKPYGCIFHKISKIERKKANFELWVFFYQAFLSHSSAFSQFHFCRWAQEKSININVLSAIFPGDLNNKYDIRVFLCYLFQLYGV